MAQRAALPLEVQNAYRARYRAMRPGWSSSGEQLEALVLALLGERRHPLAENRLPAGVRKARRETSRGSTEGMRQAMLHYRAVVEEMARMPEDREQMLEGRRETA